MGPCMGMSFETLCPVTQWPRFCFQCAGRPFKEGFWLWPLNSEPNELRTPPAVDVGNPGCCLTGSRAVPAVCFPQGTISKGNCNQSMAFRGALFLSINIFFSLQVPPSLLGRLPTCHVTSARDGQFPRLDEVE